MILDNSYEEEVIAYITHIPENLFCSGSYTGSKKDLLEDEDAIKRIAYRAQKDVEDYSYAFGYAVEEEVKEFVGFPEDESDEDGITLQSLPPEELTMLMKLYCYIKENDIQNNFINPNGKNKE